MLCKVIAGRLKYQVVRRKVFWLLAFFLANSFLPTFGQQVSVYV